MKAKDFTLADQSGKTRSLADFAGKWLVLYFYPKDNTPGCTKEACNFRDNIDKFRKMGVEIAGISKDSVASHQKFANKFHLNFPILSDQSLKIIKGYGAWGQKKFMGKVFEGTLRNTYLINPEGEIYKTYEKVNPLVHAQEILSDLKSQVK